MNKLILPAVQKNVSLASMNTMGLPAKASEFVELQSEDELISLHKNGFFEKQKPFVLGGGSNVLFKHEVSKTVLKVSLKGIDIVKVEENSVLVKIGAGENWHRFVEWAVNHGYGGVENLALIPGTVGAAPIQNIGAYGVELKEVFEELICFDLKTGSFHQFTNQECKFGYRDSIFKKELEGHVIITSVTLRLTKKNHLLNTSYRSLKDLLKEKNIEKPTIRDIFNAVVAIRRSKLPDPKNLGNAGSFFKNPVLSKKSFERLLKNFSEVPHYPVDEENVKIPAGWLIEQAGWKGKRVGNVGTYENQALVIVNHGGATGDEVYRHALKVQQSVQEKFGIQLVPEVNIVE